MLGIFCVVHKTGKKGRQESCREWGRGRLIVLDSFLLRVLLQSMDEASLLSDPFAINSVIFDSVPDMMEGLFCNPHVLSHIPPCADLLVNPFPPISFLFFFFVSTQGRGFVVVMRPLCGRGLPLNS